MQRWRHQGKQSINNRALDKPQESIEVKNRSIQVIKGTKQTPNHKILKIKEPLVNFLYIWNQLNSIFKLPLRDEPILNVFMLEQDLMKYDYKT